MEKENREVKSSVFADLFYEDESAEKNIISLYNALHEEPLPEETQIEKIHVGDAIYMNLKNDISFGVGGKTIIMGEHQSTVNENMPLRNLLYIGRVYEQIVPSEARYRKKRVTLAKPEFYTFYNGIEKEEKESYLQINWDELLQRNKDVKAWIQITNTNVNYPVLQGETNDTYIHSDIDHNELSAGSIFIASENEDPFNDFNTVIYGHNMKNGSMFNNIKSYTDQSFADEHPYVYIYLPDGTVSQYKVVVGHIISESSVLYSTQIVDTASFVQEMVKTSSIKVDFDQSQVQSVITLSTCTSAGSESGKRNVVHAILQRKGIDPVKEKMEN